MAAKHAKVCFGSELRRLRLQAGMSLRLLARRSGISPVYLSDIENSRKPAPSVEILHTLIHVLHADSDTLMSLAVKSVEQYGGTARKPRLPDSLSADEYLLVMKKKQLLEAEEFKQWLHSTAVVAESKGERKVKKRIRDIITANLLHERPLVLAFDDADDDRSNTAHAYRWDNNVLCGAEKAHICIRHYEGQSEKEALAIYIDTCYREWYSMKNSHTRELYIEALQHTMYILHFVALRASTADEVPV